MAPTLLTTQHYHKPHTPTLTSFLNSSKFTHISPNLIQCSNIITGSKRRRTIIATVGTILLAREVIFNVETASCFDFRITVPDQTVEEAESVVKAHAQDLLDLKPLIDSESWREAQKAIRRSSGLLKQDIYTIIQSKPGNQRPLLRKIYSQLFNNVTKLDYAARSKDAALVQECYHNIVVALDDIMSRI